MAQMTSEDRRSLCLRARQGLKTPDRRSQSIRCRAPFVGADFLADVEKTLDGWEMCDEALVQERKRDC